MKKLPAATYSCVVFLTHRQNKLSLSFRPSSQARTSFEIRMGNPQASQLRRSLSKLSGYLEVTSWAYWPRQASERESGFSVPGPATCRPSVAVWLHVLRRIPRTDRCFQNEAARRKCFSFSPWHRYGRPALEKYIVRTRRWCIQLRVYISCNQVVALL